jgi:hypothetical protein
MEQEIHREIAEEQGTTSEASADAERVFLDSLLHRWRLKWKRSIE